MLAKALTSALILCVPTGFSESDRVAWLKAACVTLKGIPLDLLQRGIETVRKTADHPAKIVPGVVAEVESSWNIRKERMRGLNAALLPRLPSPEGVVPVPCTPEEAAKILAEECPNLSQGATETVKRYVGPPRKPSAADYDDIRKGLSWA